MWEYQLSTPLETTSAPPGGKVILEGLGMTPQHFHTIPTSCAILPPITNMLCVFVSCVQRVVEGSVVGSAGSTC